MNRKAFFSTAVLAQDISRSEAKQSPASEFHIDSGASGSVSMPELDTYVHHRDDTVAFAPQRLESGRQTSYSSRLSDSSTWVDRYGGYLFRYSLMRVRNRELAENLVQETFLAALAGRDSFSGRSSEKTWMTGILKHKIIDQFRKSLREKAITELQTDDEQTIDGFYDAVGHPKQYPKSWMPDPQALLHSKEFWEVLHSCIDRLPKRTASAFIMRELDDWSTDDICRELEITPTNLWVMLHRARLQLRELLEEHWFEKGRQLLK